MGGIGPPVEQRAGALGMEVQYHNRNRLSRETEQRLQATYISDIETLARQSDVLSLHCPLTDETRHLVNESILSIMQEHAILINTSRGPVMDENALAEARHTP